MGQTIPREKQGRDVNSEEYASILKDLVTSDFGNLQTAYNGFSAEQKSEIAKVFQVSGEDFEEIINDSDKMELKVSEYQESDLKSIFENLHAFIDAADLASPEMHEEILSLDNTETPSTPQAKP